MDTVKGIIFDFNGTMIYDSPIHRGVWMDFIPEHGGVLTEEGFDKRILGRDNAHILVDFFGELSEEQIARMTYEKEAEYRRRCVNDPRFRLVDGLEAFLDRLKAAGIPMTIATGSERLNVEFYFSSEKLGLERWFDFGKVVYDDCTFPGKPNPDIFLKAAEKLGIPCGECMIFEDSYSGIIAAHRAGAKYIVALGEGVSAGKFTDAGGVDAAVENFLHPELFPGLPISF